MDAHDSRRTEPVRSGCTPIHCFTIVSATKTVSGITFKRKKCLHRCRFQHLPAQTKHLIRALNRRRSRLACVSIPNFFLEDTISLRVSIWILVLYELLWKRRRCTDRDGTNHSPTNFYLPKPISSLRSYWQIYWTVIGNSIFPWL